VKNSRNAFYNACGTITSKNTDWTVYQFYLGRYTSTALKPTLTFDGGTFNFTNTFTVGYVGPATAVFSSGTLTNRHGAALNIGAGGSNADGTLLVKGGKHVLDYPMFHLGDDGGKGVLVIDGTNTEFVVNDLNTYLKLGGDTAAVTAESSSRTVFSRFIPRPARGVTSAMDPVRRAYWRSRAERPCRHERVRHRRRTGS
jgi:hypothetical protein